MASTGSQNILSAAGLSKSYGSNKINFPELAFESGEKYLVYGKSGVGKSTLIKILSGILLPDHGDLKIKGENLLKKSESERDAFRGKYMGLAFQNFEFISSLNAIENLKLAAKASGLTFDKNRVLDLSQRLSIQDKLNQSPYSMSFGEQQRLNFLRAIQHQPDLVFADEPTAFLDDDSAHDLIEVLNELTRASNSTLVVVSHDQRLKQEFIHKIAL